MVRTSTAVLLTAIMTLGGAVLVGCGGNMQLGETNGFDFSAYAGNWTGTWQSLDRSRQGAATVVVTLNQIAGTFTVDLDLEGEVFPGTDPAPVSFQGTYSDDGGAASAEDTSLGDLQLTVGSGGNIAGNFSRVPHAAVRRIDFGGRIMNGQLLIQFTAILADGGLAYGNVTLRK